MIRFLVDSTSDSVKELKDLKLENSSLLSKFTEFNTKIAEAR